jgi:hypothetical protein
LHVSFVNKFPGNFKRRLYQADFRVLLSFVELKKTFDVPLIGEGSNGNLAVMLFIEFRDKLLFEKALP